MSGVFINYRVDDGSMIARFLYEHLVAVFGKDQVYLVNQSIKPGAFFDEDILSALHKSDVLLAVMGRSWISMEGKDGLPRIQNQDDWVRREIAVALACRIPVIPLLVEGAAMPDPVELPPNIRDLTRCDYLRLNYRGDESGVTTVVARLRPLLRGAVTPPEPQVKRAGSNQNTINGDTRGGNIVQGYDVRGVTFN